MTWQVFKLISISILSFFFFFGVTFYLKHKANLKQLEEEANSENEGLLIGTLDDLEQAEKDVAELDLEAKLIETHQLVESFNTMHGFDTNYLENLVQELAAKGINATYLFKQIMPTGVTGASSGVFQLFVNKEAVQEAQQLIKNKLSMKT